VSEEKKKKTLIPTFSRKREKGCAGVSFLNPLPLAREGRMRVFLSIFLTP
jgi:hypothetical protein